MYRNTYKGISMLDLGSSNMASYLRDLRKSQNKRISDLAKETGLSEEAIQKIESGRDFKVSSLFKLMGVLSPRAMASFLPPEVVGAASKLSPMEMLNIERSKHVKKVRVK